MLIYNVNFCECFCGGEASFYTKTFTKRGLIKGDPCHYINGHTRKGKQNSEEHKIKVGNALKGRIHSEEVKEKNRQSHLGKKASTKTKLKQSISLKKVIHTEEWNKKAAQANTGKKRSEKARQNISKAHKGINIGEKNPNWKGGITSFHTKLVFSDEYINWRTEIFKRDNYTCCKCNIRGDYLQAHHIINLPKLIEEKQFLFDINNGITFCRNCHKDFHKIYTKFNNNVKQIYKFVCKSI